MRKLRICKNERLELKYKSILCAKCSHAQNAYGWQMARICRCVRWWNERERYYFFRKYRVNVLQIKVDTFVSMVFSLFLSLSMPVYLAYVFAHLLFFFLIYHFCLHKHTHFILYKTAFQYVHFISFAFSYFLNSDCS